MDKILVVVIFVAILDVFGQIEGVSRRPTRRPRHDLRLYRLQKRRLHWAGEPVVRPVDRDQQSTPTPVDIDYYLLDIQSLKRRPSYRTADLQTMGWLHLKWMDPGLRWTPSEFGGINKIRLPIDMLWTPDIKLYGSSSATVDQDKSVRAVVFSNGAVLWAPPTKFYSVCFMINGTLDEWQCRWKLGSWTYDAGKLSLQADKAKLTIKIPADSLDWKIKDVTVSKKSKVYACCPEPYEYILMSFVLSANW